MSYILDALRKSERERQAGQAPGLPHLAMEPAGRHGRGLVIAVAGLMLLNLSALGWWFLGRLGPSPDPVGQGAGVPIVAPAYRMADRPDEIARIASPALPASPTPATLAPAEMASPGAARSSPPGTPSPPLAISGPDTLPAGPEQGRPMPPLQASNARERRLAGIHGQSPGNRAYPSGDVTAIEETDEGELTASQDRVSPAPSVVVRPWPGGRPDSVSDLRDLPLDFQDRVPPLKISMFAYARDPTERFVIIDMKKYHAGDRLPGNLLLLEIQAENLLLELDGRKFRVPRF